MAVLLSMLGPSTFYGSNIATISHEILRQPVCLYCTNIIVCKLLSVVYKSSFLFSWKFGGGGGVYEKIECINY